MHTFAVYGSADSVIPLDALICPLCNLEIIGQQQKMKTDPDLLKYLDPDTLVVNSQFKFSHKSTHVFLRIGKHRDCHTNYIFGACT
jgi:hypothetical protein